jgi:hypothetical protein
VLVKLARSAHPNAASYCSHPASPVRAAINLRSNSQMVASTSNSSLPCGVVASSAGLSRNLEARASLADSVRDIE